MTSPTLISRADHCISRDNIDDNALKVLYRLHRAGYRALLVGGGVRDLLLNRRPKDFDIATDAHPEEVCELFSNCRLIGRRFRLAHIYFGRNIVEVATFRANDALREDHDEHELDASGRILRDNVYGDIDDDVWRRDFTISALYYDIADFSVIDYAGAMADIEQRVLRLIGDPDQRYREDPVRMLRAIRFAAKLDLTIHEDTLRPIAELGHLLADIPAARLFDEVLKLFHSGHAVACLELLQKHGLLKHLFPHTAECLNEIDSVFGEFLRRSLENTDRRIGEGKPITPAFLFASMLWQPVQQRALLKQAAGDPVSLAMQHAMSEVISEQVSITAIPRRFSTVMREIWGLQHRFKYRQGRRAQSLLSHPKFRAAYDFMCIRSHSGELTDDSCEWWTQLQEMGGEQRTRLLKPAKRPRKRKPGRAD